MNINPENILEYPNYKDFDRIFKEYKDTEWFSVH